MKMLSITPTKMMKMATMAMTEEEEEEKIMMTMTTMLIITSFFPSMISSMNVMEMECNKAC